MEAAQKHTRRSADCTIMRELCDNRALNGGVPGERRCFEQQGRWREVWCDPGSTLRAGARSNSSSFSGAEADKGVQCLRTHVQHFGWRRSLS